MGQVYSVSQVNKYINGLMQEDFLLSRLSVQGEVSNCRYRDTGHLYFSLKEEGYVISVAMFQSRRSGLSFRLEDGMKVVVTGKIGVYEAGGTYQIYADRIEASGEGDLRKRYEELKKKLAEMGMFDGMYKKPIPKYASRVGVVTSRTGAAVQDIINIATRRNPYVQLILCPAIVQGEECPGSVIRAIRALEEADVDVIIVGRGGGSMEDLWGFNDETLAEAVFSCSTPIISAVGHETDFTIIDEVADLRAPTPSAAAELAVFSMDDFEMSLMTAQDQLLKRMTNHLQRANGRLSTYRAELYKRSPGERLAGLKGRYRENETALKTLMKTHFEGAKHRYDVLLEAMKGRSPLGRMSLGFAHVERKDGSVVLSSRELKKGDDVELKMKDGSVSATVREIRIPETDDER